MGFAYYATVLAAYKDSRHERSREASERSKRIAYFASLRTGGIIIFAVGRAAYDTRENH